MACFLVRLDELGLREADRFLETDFDKLRPIDTLLDPGKLRVLLRPRDRPRDLDLAGVGGMYRLFLFFLNAYTIKKIIFIPFRGGEP